MINRSLSCFFYKRYYTIFQFICTWVKYFFNSSSSDLVGFLKNPFSGKSASPGKLNFSIAILYISWKSPYHYIDLSDFHQTLVWYMWCWVMDWLVGTWHSSTYMYISLKESETLVSHCACVLSNQSSNNRMSCLF